ncbi:hypothetical protein FEDK69T_09190 [Flavobacterium enshiense DK69]|uniref:DUF4296 domain-containing protein n=1 Tax=Flavobacterium enshiense TaxID=1341165 RepID=UPI0003C584E6|nr:DUF4296 domain-containing protein [Flavobacterium enshiense]ESU24472.1 hypothetical protein FEDK69T_09190 [Flavobacterium enshiense DK69]
MKKIAFLILCLTVLSCKDSAVEKPDNLLSEEVMVDVLYDLSVLQSAENLNSLTFSQNNIKVNELIYKKYNIDSITFAKNDRYYAADPHNYQKLFKKVAEKIEASKKVVKEQLIKETGKEPAPSGEDMPRIQ